MGNLPARQVNIGRDWATVLAVQDGDLHVHQRIGTHTIEEIDFSREDPGDAVRLLPSRLLNAANQIVTFTGRTAELEELARWRDSPEGAKVRLIHGGAGHGKSRLAHRFAELSRGAGWTALRARHSRDVDSAMLHVTDSTALSAYARTLVVVDYAERWPLTDLLALLLDKRLHSGPAVRVLLLARPAGGWWQALTYRLSQKVGVPCDAVGLVPLGRSPQDAQVMFDVARTSFADELQMPSLRPTSARVAWTESGSVLSVHVTALATVLAERDGDAVPEDLTRMSAYLLARERSHWQSMYDNDRRIESTPHDIGRVVYVAALTRALDHPGGVAALATAGVTSDAGQASRTLADHAMCYPPHDPATVLEPLYPDQLAEDYIGLHTPGHNVSGHVPEPWAATALRALLLEGPANGRRHLATALPMIIEASSRWPHLTRDHLLPLLREQPDLAVQAGPAAMIAIAGAPAVPIDVLFAVEAVIPPEPAPDLFPGLAAITERLAAHAPDRAAGTTGALRRAQKLGWRLLHAGRYQDAVNTLMPAMSTVENRYTRRRYRGPDLELALRALGKAHVGLGEFSPAAAVLSEAVELWDDPSAPITPPLADIADCLTDLSLALWRTGQPEKAMATRIRAVAAWRTAAATDPRHTRPLIHTLNQHAEHLRNSGRDQESLRFLDETIGHLQASTGHSFETTAEDLGATLLGRALTLRDLHRLPEAEQAASAAVEVFRRLSARNVAHDQDHARALAAYASILARIGRPTEAVASQDRSVAIYRRLATINARRHGLDLVRALISFAELSLHTKIRNHDALKGLLGAAVVLRTADVNDRVRERLRVATHALTADLLDALGRPTDAAQLRQEATAPPPAYDRNTATLPRPRPGRSGNAEQATAQQALHKPPPSAAATLQHFSPATAAAVLASPAVQPWWRLQVLRQLDLNFAFDILDQRSLGRESTVSATRYLMQHHRVGSVPVVVSIAARVSPDLAADMMCNLDPMTIAAALRALPAARTHAIAARLHSLDVLTSVVVSELILNHH